MLLLAGTTQGTALVCDMLKLGKSRDPDSRLADLWGASWDVLYTRLVGFGQDRSMWPEAPRPFVFVTDDTKLYDAMSRVDLLGIAETAQGTPMGVDDLPLHELIRPDLRGAVDEALTSLSGRVLARKESPDRIVKIFVKNSRYQSRMLRSEFEHLAGA